MTKQERAALRRSFFLRYLNHVVMNRYTYLLFCSAFTSLTAAAQEPADALRYSWLSSSGTARHQAIGGTNAALGGDLSSIFYNPAGLGLYRTGELVLTPAYSMNRNNAGYLGSEATQRSTQLNFGTTGVVLPLNGGGSRGKIKNVSVGFGINRVANFNNSVFFNGRNNSSSYSEKYLEELINNNVTDPNAAAEDFPYGASLAFNTYLIDTVSGPGGALAGYRSLATPSTGLNQSQTIETRGGINEFGLGLSANLGDRVFFGGSLNWSVLNYERNSQFREEDATNNTRNNFKYFTVDEYLSTTGVGINLKLGVIVKPVDQLRIGLALHTPTLYNMKDMYATTITSDLEGYAGNGSQTQSSRDFNNGYDGEFTYNFSNPLRLMGGISYVFSEDADISRQRGFISADIEYLNYQTSKFTASDASGNVGSYFTELNQAVSGVYRSAINARVGGELKFETFMVRGGFAYFGNPYANGNEDARRMNISGGLGWRNKGKFVDLTYVHQLAGDNYYPYRLDNGTFSPVNLRSGLGNVLITVGFKF